MVMINTEFIYLRTGTVENFSKGGWGADWSLEVAGGGV